MTVKFTNNASTTVATAINTTATSLVVASAAGFPALSGSGDYCYLTIQQAAGTNVEVVKATALSSNTFTIVRAQDGTSAGSWSVSDVVELRVTAALLTDIVDAATHDSSVLAVDSTNNRVGVNDTTPSVTLDISGTDAIALPVGTTAERPTGAAGRFRYNSSLSQFEGYTDAWGAIGGGGTNTFTTDTFTANGSLVAFNLSQTVSSANNLLCFIDGVFQTQDAYAIATASGTTTLTFSAAPANARKIVVYSVAAGISGTNLNVDSMTGDGSDVTLTLTINTIKENTQVFIDGVYQAKANYSISGTTLTFSTAPPAGSAVECVTMTQTEINVPVDNTITNTHLTPAIISGLTEVTPVLGDKMMILDATDSALKKADVKDIMSAAVSITSAADAVALTFDSSENATFAGSVGIGGSSLSLTGNATPGLTVSSNGPFILLQDANNADKVRYISNNTGELQFGIVGDDGATGKTEHMRIASTGALTSSVAGGYFETRADGGGFHYKQTLDVATAGLSITGQSNRGDLAAIRLYQTATGADGGYIQFDTSPSGSTTPTERMRLDAKGGLGLGLAVNAGWTTDPILQVGPFAMSSRATSAASHTDLGQLSTNQYWDGANHKYIAAGNSSIYTQNDGTHVFSGAPLGSAGGNISYVTGMNISAAGYATTPQNPTFKGSYSGSVHSAGAIGQNAYIQNRNMTHSGGNRITVPVAGVYLLVHHQLGSAAGTQTKIRINGSDLAGSRTQSISGNNESITTAMPVILAALDYVEFHVSAGTIHGNPNYNTMSVTLIG